MATSTNGISTWGDIHSLYGTSSSNEVTECPTNNDIKSYISSIDEEYYTTRNYSSDQLVRYSDICTSQFRPNVVLTPYDPRTENVYGVLTNFSESTGPVYPGLRYYVVSSNRNSPATITYSNSSYGLSAKLNEGTVMSDYYYDLNPHNMKLSLNFFNQTYSFTPSIRGKNGIYFPDLNSVVPDNWIFTNTSNITLNRNTTGYIYLCARSQNDLISRLYEHVAPNTNILGFPSIKYMYDISATRNNYFKYSIKGSTAGTYYLDVDQNNTRTLVTITIR